MTSDNPTLFVPSFATQQLLPPWKSKGSRNWAFVIQIDRHCIQKYLDDWFNAGDDDRPPYYWQAYPTGEHGYGVLLVCDHPDFSSVVDGNPGWNRLAHREVFWFFPAYRYNRTPDDILFGRPQVTWIQPFALDNNSFVMFSSREIWGCEKDMAEILIDRDRADHALHIDIALQGCKVFNPKSISHLIGAMHLRLAHTDAPADLSVALANRDLAGLVGSFLGGVMAPASSHPGAHDDLVNRIELNTLKQFRDAFNLRFAAYKAITCSSVTHTNIKGAKYYSGDNVTIDFMWSDSFAERWKKLFGLKAPPEDWPHRGHPHGDQSSLAKGIDWDMPRVQAKVMMAMSFTADSHFEVRDTLYTYGLDNGG